ncbi:MAG: Hpt domain-containing protein [Gemmatimonadota bacterium]|nr:Hpt domain-containing protein [Gemmatimonadota bacterium]
MSQATTIDPQALDRLREWGGDKLVAQMIRLFISNAGERVEQIRTGVSGEEVREAEMGAHSLKSSAANLGAERVRALAAAIESAAANGEMEPVVDQLPELEVAFAAAVEELESIERGISNES